MMHYEPHVPFIAAVYCCTDCPGERAGYFFVAIRSSSDQFRSVARMLQKKEPAAKVDQAEACCFQKSTLSAFAASVHSVMVTGACGPPSTPPWREQP
jgi:hypothetical protein